MYQVAREGRPYISRVETVSTKRPGHRLGPKDWPAVETSQGSVSGFRVTLIDGLGAVVVPRGGKSKVQCICGVATQPNNRHEEWRLVLHVRIPMQQLKALFSRLERIASPQVPSMP